MNVVREIERINQAELKYGSTGGSWHDEYKDSAYIFVGGLNTELSEGDVVTIFSQYGEVMDVNMPRDKETGKPRGFAFLMYEDQRSTVIAVDNLNGAKVLERTLRVDHVKNYKQPKTKNADGEWIDTEEQSMNARPELIHDDLDAASDSSESSAPDIDPEDPMRDYLLAKYKEEKASKKAKKSKSKGKSKHKDETPEERRARKERKRERKERKKKKSAANAVEDLLNSIERRMEEGKGRQEHGHDHHRSRSRTPRLKHRSRSRSRSHSQDRRRGSPYRRSQPHSPKRPDTRDRRDMESNDERRGKGVPSRGSKRRRDLEVD